MIKKILMWYLFMPSLLLYLSCSGDATHAGKEITVRISPTNTIVVNKDTVAIDSLAAELQKLGITESTEVRLIPHPVAGAATVEKVQRIISVEKSSTPLK